MSNASKFMVSCLFTILFLSSNPMSAASAAPLSPKPGVQSSAIGTIDGWSVWVGWNASFSDSYLLESETYNWFVFFSPEGVYAGLTSAASTVTSVDVFAAIGGFMGLYASPEGDQLSWGEFTDLNGLTISRGMDLLSLPVGPLSGGSLSFSVGPTFFRKGDSLDFVRAYQMNAGVSASFSLISLPLVPDVALDFKSNLTNQDTGFWPILLWDMQVDPTLSPIENVIVQLERLVSPSTASTNPMARAMAARLLPVLLAFGSSVDVPASMDKATLASYLADFLANSSSTPVSGAAEDTIDGAIASAQEWIANEDKTAPAKILDSMPIAPTDVFLALRPVKQGVEAGFEMAYRNGYDQAVEEGTREDNVIYADCVVTEYCVQGEPCSLTVQASEIAELVPGTTASDFEGAAVWFDVPAESYMEGGAAGGEEYVLVEGGKATYTFVQSATYPLLLGVAVDREYSNGVTQGKNVELCPRQVVFQSPIQEEGVSVENGTLLSATISTPDETGGSNAPDDMFMGVLNLDIESAPQATVTVTIELPSAIPAGYSWFKLLPGGSWVDLMQWELVGSEDGANLSADRRTVTLTLTDNGPLDHDSTAGHIKDPCAVGLLAGFDATGDSQGSGASDDGSNSGGGCSAASGNPSDALPTLLLLAFLLGMGILLRRRSAPKQAH